MSCLLRTKSWLLEFHTVTVRRASGLERGSGVAARARRARPACGGDRAEAAHGATGVEAELPGRPDEKAAVVAADEKAAAVADEAETGV